MTPLSLPEPSGTKPRHFTYLALAMCVLAAVYIAERANYWSRYWQTGWAPAHGKQPVSLSIGTTKLRLPLEFIATPRQRHKSLSKDNSFEKLRLSMAWPELNASSDPDGNFVGQAIIGGTILVELESSPGRESLRARLDPFYRRLARGGEIRGPDGLKILTLSARGSASKDLIVYDPAVQNGFIARCLKKAAGNGATCHRAVVLASGLELRYRFDQSLLPDWRKMDQAIVQKITDFKTVL